MLGLSVPSSIPTFAAPEVFFHIGPPILPVGVGRFDPHGILLLWQCAMIGFELLKGRQLLLQKPEHVELTVLASYITFGRPKDFPFFSRLHNVLLNAFVEPFVGAFYIEDLCWEKLNFSQRLVISLLINSLSLSIMIYRGIIYQKMMCVQTKSTTLSFFTAFKAIASAHLGK